MKILTLWLLNAAILSCAAAQANDSTAKSFDPDQFSPGRLPLNQLISTVSSKNGPDARKLLDKTPSHLGDTVERQLWLVACLSVEQRYEESISLFEKLKIKDTSKIPSVVMVRIAKAYASELNFDQAINILSQLLARKKYDDAYALRASCYSAKKDDLAAARDYECVAAMSQCYRGNYLMQAGRAYLKAGQTNKALAILSEAEKTEKNAVVYMARFECYEKLKQWNEAIGDLNRAEAKAIKTDKSKPDYHFVLPACYKARARCYGIIGDKTRQKADEARYQRISKELENELMDGK
ncbi:MAG: hypothetical protein IPP97_20280 [Candidatus Obscuribacter sp.]|nr:hypothetical protein [Candidatus Obscuribacter sp.]